MLFKQLNSSTHYYFPQRFDGSHNKLKLITELKIAALKGGFVLAQRSVKSSKQLRKGLGAYITLQCQHGAVFRPRVNLKKYVTHTHNSKVSSDKCSFAFNISMTSEDDSGVCREVADTFQIQIESGSKRCRALWPFQASSK